MRNTALLVDGGVSFQCIGTPVGQPRVRPTRRRGRQGVWMPKGAKAWRAEVRAAALEAGARPLTGPLIFVARFLMPRPRSHFRTGRYSELLRPDAPTKHTGTPDIDNVLKATLDALNKLAWHDDAQIVAVKATKRYVDTEAGEQAGATITVARAQA